MNIPADGGSWLQRVPSAGLVSLAATGLGAFTAFFAVVAGGHHGWVGPVDALVASVVLAVIVLSPIRVGPALSLAAVGAFFALEGAAGRLSTGSISTEVGLAFLLLAALLAASYVRLGIRRRDTELAIAREAITELTKRDRITQLLSGGQELTWLESELARARRHHHELSLLLVAPDGFDEFVGEGSDVALEVLEAAAEVIGNELRATDVALRYGQAVFSVILPETSAAGARVAAERVRLFLPGRLSRIGQLTVSNGIATFPRDASTNAELIAVAEHALARAVELGGNRTVCASVEDEVPPGWTLAGATH